MTNKQKLYEILDRGVVIIDVLTGIVEVQNRDRNHVADLILVYINLFERCATLVPDAIWHDQMDDYPGLEEHVREYYLNKYKFLKTWPSL